MIFVEKQLEPMKILPGSCDPLGATWDGKGVNFAIYSKNAHMVELCLFSNDKTESEYARIKINSKTGDIWHCYIPDLQPGQLYGFRFYGPYKPKKGLRFNPNKLLLDPYSKAISGEIVLNDSHYDYKISQADSEFISDTEDSSEYMPKSVVVDTDFDWGDDIKPDIPWSDTIIYELHVKGFTILNDDVPKPLRGTYAGLCSPSSLEYIKSLGVTSVELLPVHHSVPEKRLTDNGLTNYWGYNTIGFFAPDSRYSSGGALGEQVNEFKKMVKTFHKENIEVILDVVYNHTAEGGNTGPSLSFRGIDNTTYYRLNMNNPDIYENFTGTGNSVKSTEPAVIKFIIESLKYWVEEMHVDGFRFDLATVLGREEHDFYKNSELLERIYNDPVLSKVKLTAEPWDIGYGGYQLGNFPDPFSEWNDRFRNTVRKFWRSDTGQLADMAYAMCGSSNIYNLRSKGTHTSINYVCSHDGFTLEDLVSHERKHNLANLECNNDGTNANFSHNFGVEGETNNKEIIARRERQKRNFLATLFLSLGTPMLLAGDEAGRTKEGNNNSYCQDNTISWIDWKRVRDNTELLEFAKLLINIRANSPVLKKGQFFNGHEIGDTDIRDLVWYNPEGNEMVYEEWEKDEIKSLSFIMAVDGITKTHIDAESVKKNTFMILLNGSSETVNLILPQTNIASSWEVIIDTSYSTLNKKLVVNLNEPYKIIDRSLVLLKPL